MGELKRKPLLTKKVIDGLVDLKHYHNLAINEAFHHPEEMDNALTAIEYLEKLVTYCQGETYQKKRMDLNKKVKQAKKKRKGE